jgi:polysaccharide deacetylase 2 family uncharacterized protein YibQ
MKLVKEALLVLLLALLAVIVYLLLREQADYTAFGAKLDNVVMGALLDSGIKDSDITSQYRDEHREAGQVWIETVRELNIPAGCNLENLKAELESRVKRFGAEVYPARQKAGSLSCSYGKNSRVLERLIFKTAASIAKKTRIALVIDDVGYDENRVDKYIGLNVPVTFAVLPGERYSSRMIRLISKSGYRYILHMPMEPEGYPKVNPGGGALMTSMQEPELRKKFYKALNLVIIDGKIRPVGISNHMGSKFTADLEGMLILLKMVRENGLFFFDSYTSPKSVCGKAARIAGMPYLRNDVFLDNVDDQEKITKQLMKLLETGKKKGSAAGIAHIGKKYSFSAFENMIKTFRDNGCVFVYLDDLVK